MAFFDEEVRDMMSDSIIRQHIVDPFKHLSKLLVAGIERLDLQAEIAKAMGLDPDQAQATVARMNLVAHLRMAGYEVVGGRRGGKVYQITGHAPLDATPKKGLEAASTEVKEAYNWLCRFPALHETREDIKLIDLLFASNTRDTDEIAHSRNWLYLWAYMVAGQNTLRMVEHAGAVCLVFQKHKNRPRLSIIWLSGDAAGVVSLAERLAPVSVSTITVTGMPDRRTKELLELRPKSKVSRRRCAIYDLRDFVENTDKYLNKRARTTLRARFRDTEFVVNPGKGAQNSVIDAWKIENEAKHRQLAIRRDYTAVESIAENKITTGGRREGEWVAHHLVYRVPGHPNAVMLANEKSLNYDTGNGGKPGMSNWNQYTLSAYLVSTGIQFMQSGGIDGGGVGLADKKKKFACDFVDEPTVYLDFPKGEY